MSELQKALQRIKFLEEKNSILQQLADAKEQARILYRQKMEYQEKELHKVKLATRFIWN